MVAVPHGALIVAIEKQRCHAKTADMQNASRSGANDEDGRKEEMTGPVASLLIELA